MDSSIDLVYLIFNKLIDFLFNKASFNTSTSILGDVKYGWVIVSILILSILCHALLNRPVGVLLAHSSYKDEQDRRLYARVRRSVNASNWAVRNGSNRALQNPYDDFLYKD